MKLFTKTFGCQMNFADSDEMTRHFKKRGFSSTEEQESAEAILINTCTVRDMAEHKAVSFIGRLKEWKDPNKLLIVTGCAAERAKKELKHRFPHIDLIVGAKDIAEFPDQLDKFLKVRNANGGVRTDEMGISETSLPPQAANSVMQFVTIMRGCNYNCSYCIVPSVRGREVYIPVDKILNDVNSRIAEGAKEIWLLGQTVNSYKPENPPKPGYDFADLLRDVDQVPGLERLRFMSPHPHYLTEKLASTMAESKTVCEHMHLPVQSGSTKLLAKMKRNYTRESYLKGIHLLRNKIPKISITTDIIVGFPGETEQDFQDTLSLVKEADFDSAYCFKYSPRPGTLSASWEDDVPDTIKEERLQKLLEITESQGQNKAKNLTGSKQEVLVEEYKGDNLFRGKTRGSWKVRFSGKNIKLGELLQTEISSTHSRELHGRIVIPDKSARGGRDPGSREIPIPK